MDIAMLIIGVKRWFLLKTHAFLLERHVQNHHKHGKMSTIKVKIHAHNASGTMNVRSKKYLMTYLKQTVIIYLR